MLDYKIILNIDGLDGTGKQTITDLLTKGTQNATKISFPNYESSTGALVKKFLNGKLGDPKLMDPITASMAYVYDRQINLLKSQEEFEEKYDFIVFDRSYMSNYFYQAMKYTIDGHDQITDDSFSGAWRELIEFQQLMKKLEIDNTWLKNYSENIINIVLYHPNIETNFKLMEKRNENKDLYEKDKNFLRQIHSFINVAHKHQHQLLPEYQFYMIECSTKEGILYSPENIARVVVDVIQNEIDIRGLERISL